MENNRKINIILSLIIAFCGWLYVMYNVDPTTTRTFRNVSITYSNEKDLEAKGIALKSADKKSVEIEVEGHRSELNKMMTAILRCGRICPMQVKEKIPFRFTFRLRRRSASYPRATKRLRSTRRLWIPGRCRGEWSTERKALPAQNRL